MWCCYWCGDPEERECGNTATRWYSVEYGDGTDVVISRCEEHARQIYFWGDRNAREMTEDEMKIAEVHEA
jgi:hypothetical protein